MEANRDFSYDGGRHRFEKSCKESNKDGRMIPVPRELSAGCGLAWCAVPEVKEELERFSAEKSLSYEEMTELFY